MTFVLPDARFGMTATNYNLGALPAELPERDILAAANKLNEHRYRELTHKQRVFVDSYLSNDFNASLAAIECGHDERDARRVGRAMLRQPNVRLAIEYALEFFTEKQKLRFEHLVAELRVIALTSITDLIDPVGVQARADIDDDDPRWHAIKSISRVETKFGTNIKYEMHDKLGAIEKLLRILAPQSSPDDPNSSQQGGTVINNTNVNIIPVPSGHFLPPPPSPYQGDGATVIEHSQLDRVADQVTP